MDRFRYGEISSTHTCRGHGVAPAASVGPGRGAGPAACHSEDLSIALLLTLDRLSPLERAAFLLHYVFDLSFGEVASALERSKAARRQLAARARAHVLTARPRGATAAPEPSGGIDAKHAQLMSAFAAATLVSVDKVTIRRIEAPAGRPDVLAHQVFAFRCTCRRYAPAPRRRSVLQIGLSAIVGGRQVEQVPCEVELGRQFL